MNINSHVELCEETHMYRVRTRTLRPAFSIFMFCALHAWPFEGADIVNNTPRTKHVRFSWFSVGILRKYFSIFAIDTRWIYMKFAQKMYRLFVYEMCEYQDQGRIIVI